jgi:hypothetical protein
MTPKDTQQSELEKGLLFVGGKNLIRRGFTDGDLIFYKVKEKLNRKERVSVIHIGPYKEGKMDLWVNLVHVEKSFFTIDDSVLSNLGTKDGEILVSPTDENASKINYEICDRIMDYSSKFEHIVSSHYGIKRIDRKFEIVPIKFCD